MTKNNDVDGEDYFPFVNGLCPFLTVDATVSNQALKVMIDLIYSMDNKKKQDAVGAYIGASIYYACVKIFMCIRDV